MWKLRLLRDARSVKEGAMCRVMSDLASLSIEAASFCKVDKLSAEKFPVTISLTITPQQGAYRNYPVPFLLSFDGTYSQVICNSEIKHPNLYNKRVDLSILINYDIWFPVGLTQIVFGLRTIMEEPNFECVSEDCFRGDGGEKVYNDMAKKIVGLWLLTKVDEFPLRLVPIPDDLILLLIHGILCISTIIDFPPELQALVTIEFLKRLIIQHYDLT